MQIPKVEGKKEFIAAYPSEPLRYLLDNAYGKDNVVIPFPHEVLGGNDIGTFLNQNWIAERRCFLEENNQYRHPIAYGVIARPVGDTWKVFVYQRTKQTGEGRLSGKYSIGVGGHVEASDVFANGHQDNLIAGVVEAFTREANEEFTFYYPSKEPDTTDSRELIPNYGPDIDLALLINSDEGVDRFHLGIVPIVVLYQDIYEIASNEPDNVAIGFMTLEEIKASNVYDNLESWSQKILEHVFNRLS